MIALVLAAIVIAGCGDDSDDQVTSTTVAPGGDASVPDLPRNDDPSAVVCTGPPQGTFDATAIVGDPLSTAEEAAESEGCQIRVAVRDGESLALTQDFRPDRVNVAVEDETVTEIVDIG